MGTSAGAEDHPERVYCLLTPSEHEALRHSARVLHTSEGGLLRAFVQALGSNRHIRVAEDTGEIIEDVEVPNVEERS